MGGLERSSSGCRTAFSARSSVLTSLDSAVTSRLSDSTRKSTLRNESRVSVTSRRKLSNDVVVWSAAEAAVVVAVVASPPVEYATT